MPARNPFRPTAGANPPLLVGRGPLVDEFVESIDNGPGAPGRITIFTGPRGVGKTVMLNTVAQEVQRSHQWLVIEETATSGFTQRLAAAARQLQGGTTRRHLKGVTLPTSLGGIELADPEPVPLGLRDALGSLIASCERHETGLLITLDEVHSSAKPDLREFATVTQHLIREDRQIAVAFAGLPAAVSDLLNDEVTTFLRRADRHTLGDVALDEVSTALAGPIEESGRHITPAALRSAVQATGGYPFMIQLVGYHVWRKADAELIDEEAAQVGVQAARIRLGSLVHATALADLSDVDRTFLVAMSRDDGPSTTEDLAARMDKPLNYLGVYRARLINAGMIAAAGKGRVDFAIPFLREYLRDHAASLEMHRLA